MDFDGGRKTLQQQPSIIAANSIDSSVMPLFYLNGSFPHIDSDDDSVDDGARSSIRRKSKFIMFCFLFLFIWNLCVCVEIKFFSATASFNSSSIGCNQRKALLILTTMFDIYKYTLVYRNKVSQSLAIWFLFRFIHMYVRSCRLNKIQQNLFVVVRLNMKVTPYILHFMWFSFVLYLCVGLSIRHTLLRPQFSISIISKVKKFILKTSYFVWFVVAEFEYIG